MEDRERIAKLEEGLRSMEAYVKRLETTIKDYCDCMAVDSDRNKAMSYILAEKSYSGTNEEFQMEVDALVLKDNMGASSVTSIMPNRIDN